MHSNRGNHTCLCVVAGEKKTTTLSEHIHTLCKKNSNFDKKTYFPDGFHCEYIRGFEAC